MCACLGTALCCCAKIGVKLICCILFSGIGILIVLGLIIYFAFFHNKKPDPAKLIESAAADAVQKQFFGNLSLDGLF
ncbi:uncharacterized protein Dwil_GK28197 [Drosophila willistoni]|uniref:Protein midgut expression 1 n=1 Tax=Drosophila willistoni TaxID=7260 RepID=A0A0Q9X0R4_DROWI|nr:uncharacterized protein Dwil_GK28197 [Drosophila willistoni]